MRRRGFLSAASAALGLVVITQAGCGSGASAPVVVPQVPDTSEAAPDLAAQFDAVTYDTTGKHYALNARANTLVAYDADGATKWSIGGLGSRAGQLNRPTDVVFAPNERLYVIDAGNARVQCFDTSGNFLFQFGGYGANDGQLLSPNCIDVGSNGSLYVSDAAAHRVSIFTLDGVFVLSFGGFGLDGARLNGPMGLAVHGQEVYVVDTGNSRVQVYGPDGTYLRSIGGTTETLGSLAYPYDVVVTRLGNVFVSDPAGGAVCLYGANGALIRRFDLTLLGLRVSPRSLSLDHRRRLLATV